MESEVATLINPEAKITKMKDGRTHLAYKAEHVVDLTTEATLAAEIYGADEADAATLVPSLEQAQANVDATESGRTIQKFSLLVRPVKERLPPDCLIERHLGFSVVGQSLPRLPHRLEMFRRGRKAS
jgi:hypothetical protein